MIHTGFNFSIKHIMLLLSFFYFSCQVKPPSKKNGSGQVGEKAGNLIDYEKLKKQSPYPLVGSPDARQGGTLKLSMGEFPNSLNYFINNYIHVGAIFGSLYETLMITHPVTLEPVPLLAKNVKISDDKKSYTFYLNTNAKWSDGKPVTSDDVLFTYNTIMNPSNLTAVFRVSLKNFYPPVVIDSHTFRFDVKTPHWKNFITAYGFTVLPKHLFEKKDFNKDFNTALPPGSGPYVLQDVKQGRYIRLKRRTNYWGDHLPINFGANNFTYIKFKSIRERTTAIQHLKKGDIDMMAIYTSKFWVKEFNGEDVQKNRLKKKKIYNYNPKGFQGLCFNLRNDIFKDIRVRKAIAHLLNQEELIDKMMYNEYTMKNSYYPSINGNNKTNPYYYYDPEKARTFLKEAGWINTDDQGIRIKDGKRLSFDILYFNKFSEKYFSIWKETFLKYGIEMNLKMVSFATYIKRMNHYNFDITWRSWGASLFTDLESLWSSSEADTPGANNLAGFKNKQIDKIIEDFKTTYDIEKRKKLIRKADKIIYKEMPYVVLWNSDNKRIVYWDKFGHPEKYFSKYGDEYSIMSYWWYDPEKAQKLKQAMKNNTSLPEEPVKIYYDNSLKTQYKN